MSDTPLMNDDAARSPTGEILDQLPTPTPATPTPASGDPTPTKSSDPTPAPTDATPAPKPAEPAKPTIADTGAPEKYADFKVPDGVTLDAKTLEAATPIFKDLGLTQDQAQKLIDFQTAQMKELAAAPKAVFEQVNAEWSAKTLADPEISGAVSGGKTGIDAVKYDISRALDSISDPKLKSEFRDVMNVTGAGNHPAFVKTFWKLSQRIAEGSHVPGSNPSPAGQRAPGSSDRPTAAQAMYPKLPAAANG